MTADRLILASRSPQRRAILEQLGVAFEVRVADVEEISVGRAEAVARENALRKAVAVRAEDERPVLGVDTIVVVDDEIFGKPRDAEHADQVLRRLSGRTHEVVSGLALARGAGMQAATATTRVTFREVGDDLRAWYLATGEWRERAGGYAIQGRGAALVTRIEGDYLNVVGLPVAALLDLWPGIVTDPP